MSDLMKKVENALVEWGDWSRGGRERLGYPGQSTIYQAMQGHGNAAPQRGGFEMPVVVARLEAAIRDLPEQEREAVMLRYLRPGLTDKGRAKRLGVSYGTYRIVLERARWFIGGRI